MTTAWDPPQPASSDGGSEVAAALLVDPFNALAVHYGMLLGVSDFDVLAANPRGKLRLHQAWQHGPGVISGLGVTVDADRVNLAVAPGLAVVGGRETPIAACMCLNVGAWYDEQVSAKNPSFHPKFTTNRRTFSARLWLRPATCLTRRVPSVNSGCGEPTDPFQYSRVHEYGVLELVPYDRPDDCCVERGSTADVDPDDRNETFRGLRALVRDRVVPELPTHPAGWLEAFRAVAAAEAVALGADADGCGACSSRDMDAAWPFPPDDPERLLLADLPEIVMEPDATGEKWVVSSAEIDISVRRTHLPTWLIEELIAESLAGQAGPGPVPDAGGPRVAATAMTGRRLSFELTGDVLPATVEDGLEVRQVDRTADNDGWSGPLDVVARVIRSTPSAPARIVVDLPSGATPDIWFRVLIKGTGPTPVVGLSGVQVVPLAGRVGGPPGSSDDGHDVVVMVRVGGD